MQSFSGRCHICLKEVYLGLPMRYDIYQICAKPLFKRTCQANLEVRCYVLT